MDEKKEHSCYIYHLTRQVSLIEINICLHFSPDVNTELLNFRHFTHIMNRKKHIDMFITELQYLKKERCIEVLSIIKTFIRLYNLMHLYGEVVYFYPYIYIY